MTKQLLAALTVLTFTLCVMACTTSHATSDEPQPAPLHFNGTVEYTELEGGFYSIRAEDGTPYVPTNLPDEFKQDGTDVLVDAILKNDVGGIHMTGPYIEIINITARPQ